MGGKGYNAATPRPEAEAGCALSDAARWFHQEGGNGRGVDGKLGRGRNVQLSMANGSFIGTGTVM